LLAQQRGSSSVSRSTTATASVSERAMTHTAVSASSSACSAIGRAGASTWTATMAVASKNVVIVMNSLRCERRGAANSGLRGRETQ
jgi:hypothetical protein